MKKIIFSIILIALMIACLSAEKSKVAIFKFNEIGNESAYIVKMMDKIDFKKLLKGNNDFELVNMKEANKELKSLGMGIDELRLEERIDLGKKISADLMIWGSVTMQSSNEFKIDATVLVTETEAIESVRFNVKKDSKSRQASLQENLISKLSEFSKGDLENIKSLAEHFMQSANYEEAEKAYLKVIETDSDNADIYFNLGYIALMLKKYDDSEKYYLKSYELNPENIQIYRYLSASYEKQGKIPEAISALETVVEVEEDAKIWFKIAGLYLSNLDETEAIEAFESALELDPEYGEVYKELGLLLHEQEDYDSCIPYLEKATEYYPDDAGLDKKLGIAYLKTSRLDSAIEKYLETIERNPDNIKAYFNLASAYRASDENSKSVDVLLKLKELDPENPRVYNQLSDAYFGMSKLSLAEENANLAIKYEPENHAPYMTLYSVYYQKAANLYNRYLDLDEKAGEAYGKEADELIEIRDKTKEDSHNSALKAKGYLNKIKKISDKPSVMKEVKSREKNVNIIIKETEKGFMD